ncbi:methyltransferase domain-containing protein [Ottowia sp. GY511]|uniref:Class I SAM-dependent methyltransferase n=1 Tax=Ottowia flava TaxID=2675430 RepID=A0ABW4KRG5_9BURK|nr:methyltransferase domain-containing protein [Ottowia sp. GY511]TXK32858.1 methyltransferase domain-containing protein [Ottowia sp. GY511]
MPADRPPTLDPVAAERWATSAWTASPWLHEEVARRMAERLEVIRLPVQQWADWEPERGGLGGHALVAQHYPNAKCYWVSGQYESAQDASKNIVKPWWKRWATTPRASREEHVTAPPDGSVQLVWANMLAHHVAKPDELLGAWHRALSVDGFVLFSCLGPDTLKELRALYARRGWPPPAHEFTDMHDWGDQLAAAGFAEPVMDMETLTLQFETPERMLTELRELGRNLGVGRFPGLRGRGWRDTLLSELDLGLRAPAGAGPMTLSFEVIYGHALKPAPRHSLTGETHIALDDLRTSLRQRKRKYPPV